NLGRLVDDLLDLSRISRGKIELRRRALLVQDVIPAAVAAVQGVVTERRHELEIALPDEPLVISADPTRLEQVVSNLLHNAAKYTDPGGRIRLVVRRAGSDALVEVSDDGMGMPPELVARAFDLFQQGERKLDRSQGGLGIGLTLVRRLVEMH